MISAWKTMTNQRRIIAAVLALLCIASFVYFFLTTDHLSFAWLKSMLVGYVAWPVFFILFHGWGRIVEIWKEHRKVILIVGLVELILVGIVFSYFRFQAGVADAFLKAQLSIAMTMVLMILPVTAAFVIAKKELHQIYWKVAIVLGAIFLLIQPLGNVPDEETHWTYEYYISNQILGIRQARDEFILMREEDALVRMSPLNNTPAAYELYWSELKENGHREDLVQTGRQIYEGLLSEYQYVPQALGLTLGRIFGLSGAMTFLLGRIVNLALFILLTTIAMKFLPFGKLVLFIIAIMPMTLQQSASLSPDVMLIGGYFLVVSLSLYLAYRERPKISSIDPPAETAIDVEAGIAEEAGIDEEGVRVPEGAPKKKSFRDSAFVRKVGWLIPYIVLLLVTILVMPIKSYVYGLLCFLPVLIVVRKWKRDRREAIAAIVILLLALGVIASRIFIPMLTQSGGFAAESVETSYIGSKEYTIAFLLGTPVEIFRVFFNTYLGTDSYYLESLIGDSMQWLNVYMNRIYIYFFVVLFALACFRRKDEDVFLSARARLYMQFLSWASVAAVLFGLLLAYSPVTAHAVVGVQGRYFMPIVLPTVISCRSQGISIDRSYDKGILIAALICLTGAVQWILMTR